MSEGRPGFASYMKERLQPYRNSSAVDIISRLLQIPDLPHNNIWAACWKRPGQAEWGPWLWFQVWACMLNLLGFLLFDVANHEFSGELRTNPWGSSVFLQDPQRGPGWAFLLSLPPLSGGGRSQGRAEGSPGGPRRTPCAGRPLSWAAETVPLASVTHTLPDLGPLTSIRLSLSQRRYELVRHPWLADSSNSFRACFCFSSS